MSPSSPAAACVKSFFKTWTVKKFKLCIMRIYKNDLIHNVYFALWIDNKVTDLIGYHGNLIKHIIPLPI